MTRDFDDRLRDFLADEGRRAVLRAPSLPEAVGRLAPRQAPSSRQAPARLVAVLAAGLLMAAALGSAIAVGNGWLALPDGLPVTPDSSHGGEPSVPAIVSGTPTPSASLLPDLDMPGARSSPAGEYGWTGALGSRTGMHQVVERAGGGHQIAQVVFAVENDCFARWEGPAPVAVTIAGLDAWYVEPYDGPRVLFMPERESGDTTGGYALSIGDRTLCVYLTWGATTAMDELEAARQVMESIRGQAFGTNGIRIIFTLPEGWDTG